MSIEKLSLRELAQKQLEETNSLSEKYSTRNKWLWIFWCLLLAIILFATGNDTNYHNYVLYQIPMLIVLVLDQLNQNQQMNFLAMRQNAAYRLAEETHHEPIRSSDEA